MKYRKETKTIFILELSEGEASWLHNVMQNPLHAQHPTDEDLTDGNYRREFFNATRTYGSLPDGSY